MSHIRVLALSSSRSAGGAYLAPALPLIRDMLGSVPQQIAFVPFASVARDYDHYTAMVREALAALPHTIRMVDPAQAEHSIEQSDVVMVGGGNTFKLLHDLYHSGALDAIRRKVLSGAPYIGWSAGSNVAGLTIATTNDMPIIEPQSFRALALLPFQLNPHYINIQTEGFHGETRDQRLSEFAVLNPGICVVCLPEGTALLRDGESLKFTGPGSGLMLHVEKETGELIRETVTAETDLSYLL